jgi:sortase (surface protein transpeptidase)
MRLPIGKIGFSALACIGNLMAWGMFMVLGMPRADVMALPDARLVAVQRHATFVATVGKPIGVSVPAVGIDAHVTDGSFNTDTGEWTLSDTSAYFALPSVPANDSNGTTLIYGHAKPGMFEPLVRVTPGMTAEVRTQIGKTFTYEFVSMREVDPSDTTVFTDVGPPTLVLQTCSGPWDVYRALYTFKYVGYDRHD